MLFKREAFTISVFFFLVSEPKQQEFRHTVYFNSCPNVWDEERSSFTFIWIAVLVFLVIITKGYCEL